MTRIQRIPPGPGQESVWDYPRPPRIEPVTQRLRVEFGGHTIADTSRGMRVLETSHPPVYYFPPDDVDADYIEAASGSSFCEFKGAARYFTVTAGGRRAERSAWSYPSPTGAFGALAGYLAFYAQPMDACWVGDERVQPQTGDFYGGWITSRVVGPFKGAPGTLGW